MNTNASDKIIQTKFAQEFHTHPLTKDLPGTHRDYTLYTNFFRCRCTYCDQPATTVDIILLPPPHQSKLLVSACQSCAYHLRRKAMYVEQDVIRRRMFIAHWLREMWSRHHSPKNGTSRRLLERRYQYATGRSIEGDILPKSNLKNTFYYMNRAIAWNKPK